MKFRLLLFPCFAIFGIMTFTVQAEEPSMEGSPTPSVFRVEESDFVYFRIVSAKIESDDPLQYHVKVSEWTDSKDNSHREIAVVPTADIEKDGTVKNTDKAECLLQLSPSKSYAFLLYETKRMGGSGAMLGRIDLPADFLKRLQTKIAADPNDFKKWTFTFKGSKEGAQHDSEITLAFAGVRRLYELKSVDVPKDSSPRSNNQYVGNSKVPILCVCIDRNGVPLRDKKYFKSEGIRSQSRSWESMFASSKDNEWEIREGIDYEYQIRLRDVDKTFGWEIVLLTVSEIKAEDFRNNEGIIMEKMKDSVLNHRAVKFRFAPIKQQ